MENGNGALQVINGHNVMSWSAMQEQARMLVKSGFLPPSINTPEKAVAIALTAKELGIGMMEGFRSINVIQGKPTVSPHLMLALANRTGQVEDMKIETTDEKCVVTIKRKGRTAYTCEFGKAEASAMGLSGKDNYKKQPKTMFQWRALAANLRVTFPDVVLGLYTPDEMGANVSVGENEEMIVKEAETAVEAPKQVQEVLTPKVNETLPTPENEAFENAIVMVEEVLEKKSKKGTPIYWIKDTEGAKYSTFSKSDYETAEECRIRGQRVDILFKTVMGSNGILYNNIQGLRAYSSELITEDITNA